jgi:hypothetical protein
MSVSKMKKRKLEHECRVFQEKWESMYFFSVVRDKIVCLICNKGVSAPKEYNLRRHYETIHKDKFCKFCYFTNYCKEIKTTLRMVCEGMFMKAAEILRPGKQQLFKTISLSAHTVADRVNDLEGDIQCQLKENCKDVVAYSIAIDESTDVTDIAQLAVFIRGVNEDFQLVVERLELVPTKGKTGDDELFSELVTVFSKYELPWEKMVGFVSDGAPAMIGTSNGVAAKLKKRMKEFEGTTSFFSLHCILHQEALCAKSLKMTHVMDTVVKTVNFIRASALTHRKFVALLG